MSSRIPKTGLAALLRTWMLQQTRPWTTDQLCDALDLSPGRERDRVRNVIPDFIARAEVIPVAVSRQIRNRRQFYAYNRAYRRIQKGVRNKKIQKAAYVSVSEFTIVEIQRLSEAPSYSYADKVIRALVKAGQINVVGRRPGARGFGTEILYHIADRDRFRMEVMR